MKIIYSIPLKKQPFQWKQAFANAEKRKWTIKTILLYPFINYFYEHKNKHSFLFDELIIGSNPIINIIKLYQISKYCIDKDISLKIGLIIPDENDYWAYEIINKSFFWEYISKKINYSVANIEDFIKFISHNLAINHISIYLIDNQFSIKYIRFDKYVDGWILGLFNKENTAPEVEEFIKIQNNIRILIEKCLLNTLSENNLINKIKWINADNDNFPVALSRKINLTSLPQGWLNMNYSSDSEIVSFQHELSTYSHGTAISICNNKNKFIQHSFSQLKTIDF